VQCERRQHGVSCRTTHVGTRQHRPEMRGLDVFAALVEAVSHRRMEAGAVTTLALVDTPDHLGGLCFRCHHHLLVHDAPTALLRQTRCNAHAMRSAASVRATPAGASARFIYKALFDSELYKAC
jgi:hypothetical protein